MRHAETTPEVPSLRMFPRLAVSNGPDGFRQRRRLRSATSLEPAGGGQRSEDGRSQLRHRLLRMILDNEQVRRNEQQRPTAG